jgi:2-dehydro-3-deoxygluconokinase
MNTGPVVTIGEALMVLNGPPNAPIDRGAGLSTTFAGAESNVAIGLARLGHPVRWVSSVGEDLFGQVILRSMRGEGVDVSRVLVRRDGPTAMMVKSRRAAAEWEVFYYRRGSAMSLCDASSFSPDAWSDACVLYMTGITPALSAGCRKLVARAMADARARGIPVWFDPNHRRKLWSDDVARQTMLALLRQVDVALVGLAEGQLLTGSAEPVVIAQQLQSLGVKQVIVKAGAAGVHLFDGEHFLAPMLRIERIVDPIGAGDGFAAGFLSAHLDGLTPLECLHRGNAVGAMVCLTQGDWEGLPTRQELSDFVAGHTESRR